MSRSAGLSAVMAKGDGRASLEALRAFLTEQVESCESARDVAALTARLLDVMARLDAMPAAVRGTPLDELAQRRAAGDTVTARPARARRG